MAEATNQHGLTADHVAETLTAAKEELELSSARTGQVVTLPDEGSVVFTGDLHDHRTNWRKITHVAALHEREDRHLVVHELIHGDHFDEEGREDSWVSLYHAAELLLDFPDRVHMVLANHDLAQVHGEGISKGGLGVCEAFTKALRRDFGDDWRNVDIAVTELVLAMPLAVRAKAAGLFFCHSLPDPDYLESFDYDVFGREKLSGEDYKRKVGPAYRLIWGRGASPTQAAEFAQAVGADVLLTGHQPQPGGYFRNGDHHIILASDHNRGVCLPLPLDKKLEIDEIEKRITPLVAVDDSGDEDE
jgi:hypothetical protein